MELRDCAPCTSVANRSGPRSWLPAKASQSTVYLAAIRVDAGEAIGAPTYCAAGTSKGIDHSCPAVLGCDETGAVYSKTSWADKPQESRSKKARLVLDDGLSQ